MQLLYEVVLDLYTFARDSIASLYFKATTRAAQPNLFAVAQSTVSGTHSDEQSIVTSRDIFYMPPKHAQPILSAPVVTEPVVSTTAQSLGALISETIKEAPQRNTIVYASTHEAPLRTSKEIGIDNVLARIPYGSMLVALESEGEWVRAFHRGVEGWVELHDLADRAAHVYPKLVIGEKNLSDDPNTLRIRAIISDEFSLGEGGASLTAEEYVLYKLKRRGAEIVWGAARPRRAGDWAKLLQDSESATIGSEPKQRSIMEWKLEDGSGHLAYVEALFPDESIQISEVNWPDEGTYNERVLVKEEWQRLNPQFIYIV